MSKKIYFILSFVFFLVACKSNQNHLFKDVSVYNSDGKLNVVIEIPAGTNQKWEVNKESGIVEHEIVNGVPRVVQYLPYPGNYGFIPQTILTKEKGGDGDPLDVLVLGESVERGTILEVEVIGILKLLDRGEQDDKIIAVDLNSVFAEVNSIEMLENNFQGITDIIEIWFENYKGVNMMKSNGFQERDSALSIINYAVEEFLHK